MSYVAAAYGIVAFTVAAYGFYLVRERRQLRRSLAAATGQRGAGSPEEPPTS